MSFIARHSDKEEKHLSYPFRSLTEFLRNPGSAVIQLGLNDTLSHKWWFTKQMAEFLHTKPEIACCENLA